MNKQSQNPIYCTKEKSCYCPKCQPINMTSQEIKDIQEEKELEDIFLDYCDPDCVATHSKISHISIKNTVKKRIKQLLKERIKQARADERKKMVAVLEKAEQNWEKCAKKDCNNKEECERANHYIDTIWNKTFEELKTKFTQ